MLLNSVIFASGSSVGAILESINQEKLLLPKMVSAASGILSLQFPKMLFPERSFHCHRSGQQGCCSSKVIRTMPSVQNG